MIRRPLCFACLLFLIVQSIILIVKGGHSAEMPADSIFWQEEGEMVLVEGQVYKKQITSNTQMLYLKNNSITYQNNSFYDSKLIVYDSQFHSVPIGKTIKIWGTICHFDRARNPGNFDQTFYYAKEKIYGAILCDEVLEIHGKAAKLKEYLCQLRMRWKDMLTDIVGEEQGAILAAMLLGEKSGMDAEIKELYQKNGIGHILAISGLHISFIGLGIYKLIRKIGLSHVPAGICSIVVLSLYAMMIGASISVLRAFIMLFLRIGAEMTGRVYDMMTALMLSAAIVIGYQPLYLMDAAFYLSYGAIMGILFVQPAIEKTMDSNKKWMAACLSGVGVNLMLFPIQLWFYYEFPVYSLLMNFIVIPLTSVLLGAAMYGSILYLIWKPLGRGLIGLCSWILDFFRGISRGGMDLPFARMVTGQPELWKSIVYYLILVVVLLLICFHREDWKKGKWCWLLLIIGIGLLICQPEGKLRITMLDVGQGDGILVEGPTGVNYFIDGGSSDINELGKYRIEPCVKSQGVGTLDYVFISHGDADHYSGIKEMLSRQDVGVKIQNLVVAENYKGDTELLELIAIAKENGTNVGVMKEGLKWADGDFAITCLQSGKDLEGNAGSMVLELELDNFNMLFTGDVEGAGEKELIKKLDKGGYDVLKVAHHGSKNSTSEEFLREVKPKLALISAGQRNSYGHPHREVMGRLESQGCAIYETKKSGAITIETDGKDMRVDTFCK